MEKNGIELAHWIRFYIYCRHCFDVSFSFEFLLFIPLHLNLGFFNVDSIANEAHSLKQDPSLGQFLWK